MKTKTTFQFQNKKFSFSIFDKDAIHLARNGITKFLLLVMLAISWQSNAQNLNFTIDTAVDNGTSITETIVSGGDTYVLTVFHSGNEELDDLGGGDLVFYLSAIDPLTPYTLSITKNGSPTNFSLNSIDYDTLGQGTISVTNQDGDVISNPTTYAVGSGTLVTSNPVNALDISQVKITPTGVLDLNKYGFHNINVDIMAVSNTLEVPTILQNPICADRSTLSGYTSNPVGTIIRIYKNGSLAYTATVYNPNNGNGNYWIADINPRFSPGDVVQATAYDGNSESAFSPSFTVPNSSTATLEVIGSSYICNGNGTTIGGTVTLNGLPPDAYEDWRLTISSEDANGNFDNIYVDSSGNGSWSLDVNPTSDTTYTLFDLDVTSGCGSSFSNRPYVEITVNALPTPTISGATNFCTGSSTVLDAGAYTNYLWSTGETTQTISVNTAETFTVTVTDENGCIGTGSVTTVENPNPTVTFTAPADLDEDAGVQTNLGGGLPTGGIYSGSGVTDDGNGLTYSFDPTAAGVDTHTLTYTFTNASSCTGSASDDVEVFAVASNTPPIAVGGNLITVSVEENQTFAYDVDATDVEDDLAGLDLTYAISTIDGIDRNLFDIEANTGVVTFTVAPDFENPQDYGGNNGYNIRVLITDSQGAQTLQNLSINVTDVDETPTCEVAIQTTTVNGESYLQVCEGSTDSFLLESEFTGNGSLSFQWQFLPSDFSTPWQDIVGATGSTVTVTPTVPDNYYYRIVVKSDNTTPGDLSDDCTAVSGSAVTIYITPSPTVTFTAPADLDEDVGVQTGLGGGLPTGGIYSGPGVTDDGNGLTYSFDPAVAGVDTHTLTYTFTSASGCTGSASDNVEVLMDVIDTTAPIITLVGDNAIELNVGESYQEQGATATDEEDGDLTDSIFIDASSVDTNVAGNYAVTYNVSDAAGNPAVEVIRAINVNELPACAITNISLISSSSSTECDNSGTSDASDDFYYQLASVFFENAPTTGQILVTGDISQSINVPEVINGSLTFTMQVPADGLEKTIEITFSEALYCTIAKTFTAKESCSLAIDETAPIITLLGDNVIELNVGDTYQEFGATATDDVDGDLTDNIVIDASAVDTSIAGNYTVTYNVSDTADNAATEVTRMVNVNDTLVFIEPCINRIPQIENHVWTGGISSVPSIRTSFGQSFVVPIGVNEIDGITLAFSELRADYKFTVKLYKGLTTDGLDPVIASSSTYAQASSEETYSGYEVQFQFANTLSLIPGDNYYFSLTPETYDDYHGYGGYALNSTPWANPYPDGASFQLNDDGTFYHHDANADITFSIYKCGPDIIDETAPIITLLGNNPLNLNVGDTYQELGAIATDNIEGDLSENIIIDASGVDTSILGSYSITYNVSDNAGNTATEVTRIVNVQSCVSDYLGVIENLEELQDYNEINIELPDNYLVQTFTVPEDITEVDGIQVNMKPSIHSDFVFTLDLYEGIAEAIVPVNPVASTHAIYFNSDDGTQPISIGGNGLDFKFSDSVSLTPGNSYYYIITPFEKKNHVYVSYPKTENYDDGSLSRGGISLPYLYPIENANLRFSIYRNNEILDTDGDGVCNEFDVCEGFDDNIDLNENGIPDGCDIVITDNDPDESINLALLEEAILSGSVSNGRGTPEVILYDPLIDDYRTRTNWNEYGVGFGVNLGRPDADNGFKWQVDWPTTKAINYVTFGGVYYNQPQPDALWRISYLNNGQWMTLDEGQGGWIDSGIYEWDGTAAPAITADALRVQIYSDGETDLVSIHLRGRGGVSNYRNDSGTATKATLIMYLPPVGAPVADFNAVTNVLSVDFDASPSTDDGGIVNYQWNFGDGNTSNSGPTVMHTYAESGIYSVTLRVTDADGLVDVISKDVMVTDGTAINEPDENINLALLEDATVSGSVTDGRGTPEVILYDPSIDDYFIRTNWNEYGVEFRENLGRPDADNGFLWQVDWTVPKAVNYITFGGTYSNQPQPNAMWRISYLNNADQWITIDQGQGGWIDSGIYEWDGRYESAITAAALRVQVYSDGITDLVSIHLRARGGVSDYINDSGTDTKATLIQYLPKASEVPLRPENTTDLMRLSPNPTSGYTLLSFEVVTAIEFIEIHDLTGRLMSRVKGGEIDKEGKQISVQGLPNGIYTVKAMSTTGTLYQKKLIKI